jgi:hypothetical protein
MSEREDERLVESQHPQVADALLERLGDHELEVELTVAAAARGRHRWPRYEALLAERNARRS